MGEWNEVILEGVVSVLGDGLHGTPNYDDNGDYYFINGNNLSDGKIVIKDSTKRANKNEYEKYKKDLNDRTILVSINGTIGNVALYNNEKCILGKSACYFNVVQEVDKHFIKYVVTNKNFQEYIHNFANGTTIKNVSLNTMREYPFLLPPLQEQQTIASILSSLDDKVDLLHRQNKTLEALAETLFRQWIVEEADESWEEKSLIEIADYLNGLALQKFPPKGYNDLPVIKIREMKQGITENTDHCNKEIPSQYIIQDGDILFSWSGSLEIVIWSGGEGALNQHLFKLSSKKYPKWFYYLATQSHLPTFKSIAESKTTTMGHIQREHLKQATISIPPKELFDSYDRTIAPLIEKVIKNNFQIRTLTQLRDTLLPKLMSGEVRVKYA
jgi:type I restriction enzyme S subunit